MNIFHHKDLGNHLLQLCPKFVKHPVYCKGVIELTIRQLFITQQVTLKVPLNNTIVSIATLGKIKRKIGLLCAVLNFTLCNL